MTKVSEMPAAQMELFAPEPTSEQPTVEALCELIRNTAMRSYGKPIWWEDPYCHWIACHFQPEDYGLTGIDKRRWGKAISTVGVEVGNLPAFVLKWYEDVK